MKSKHIIGGVLIATCIAIGIFSLRSSMTPYVSFTEAIESQRTVQIVGSLVDGTTNFEQETGKYNFTIKDEDGGTMNVSTKEGLPSNFNQSTFIVAVGKYETSVFVAERILVKCPSKYDRESSGEEHPGVAPK